MDARTGERCPGFADVKLREGVQPLVEPREFTLTSPATVVGDLIVVGSSVPDLIRANAPHGIVRAFDARSGELRWTFHTIPAAGDPGAETWGAGTAEVGAANVWSTITADLERGLVFLPVSSASPDHYGGARPGANLYSDSVVALDAQTGKLEWHFQAVHHDLWDYDLAAPPILIDIRREGRDVPAVVVLTKTSLVFVLHRETGEPLFPIEERAVPASDVPGERASPTQPFPVRPPPLSSHRITEADLYDVTPEHRDACSKRLANLRNDGIYTPPSLQGTLVHPATGGGANWSGGAFDPVRRLLFVPVNNLGIEIRLAPTGRDSGERYRIDGGHALFAHDGMPCNRPPWGTPRRGRRRQRRDRVVGVDEHGPRRSRQLELRTAAIDGGWTRVPRRHVVARSAYPRRNDRRAHRQARAACGRAWRSDHLQAAAGGSPIHRRGGRRARRAGFPEG